ncbi:MAG: N-formylglutamate amidohydrolase [Emcibacter sp.]|nr:N-formylglutamate amidohydrolase [Emcibacter sp.]
MINPYSILKAGKHQNGILFNSPHSGVYLPDHFLDQISVDPSQLPYSRDSFIDQLIKDTIIFGATNFIQHYCRLYVDTNRSAQEIDPEMFHLQDQKYNFERNYKVANGFGIFARKDHNGFDLYKKKLPPSEIDYRINQVYNPVHNALKAELEKIHHRNGYYILIDCHSMPSHRFINLRLSHQNQSDLIIGNNFHKSCSHTISQFIKNYFTACGLKVSFNTPYSGGYNTQHYGKYHNKPENKHHAIQLEFNRALYMDEGKLEPHSGFRELEKCITGLSESLSQNINEYLPDKP